MTLAPYLAELLDPAKELKSAGLIRLSGLLNDEQPEFQARWDEIAVERRRDIVHQLVELAEANAELDFHAVFCGALVDEDAIVRESAVGGLWESDDRTIIPKLIERLKSDPDEAVRAASALVLGHFAALAESGKLLGRDGERVYHGLLSALESEDEPISVRRRALESVAAFRVTDLGDWVRWGYESAEANLRQSALCAMGRSGDDAWLPVICREMGSQDPAMRFEAANAARDLGEEEALPHLVGLVEDNDMEVALAALQAIGAIGGAQAKKLLRRHVAEAEDEVIQEAAEEALRSMEAGEGELGQFRLDRPG